MKKPAKTSIGRFWEKVRVRTSDDCWFWTASCRRGGYGQFSLRAGQIVTAHRYAWVLVHGPVPAGLYVRHLCEGRYAYGDITYRKCCNPLHLKVGTQVENMADAMNAERIPVRQQRPNFKYTDEQVLMCLVYALTGRTPSWTAVQLNMKTSAVRRFVHASPSRAINAELSKNRRLVKTL